MDMNAASMTEKKQRIAILGSGMMGKGIALLFAVQGYPVAVYALDGQEAPADMAYIAGEMHILADHDLMARQDIPLALDRISVTDDFTATVAGAAVVIESVIEDLAIKQDYFARLDALCPGHVILASNTSAISITEIGAKVKQKERLVGMHFWNPPYLLPLVEVIRTEYTGAATVEAACALLNDAGKKPIVVQKDVPGFLANRLQHALVREAFSIVQNGIASPKDVDDAIKYGFGMRLPFAAPLEVSDSVGLDMAAAIQTYLFPHLSNAAGPEPFLREKIAGNELGFKTQGRGIQTWSREAQDQYRRDLLENIIKVGKALGRF